MIRVLREYKTEENVLVTEYTKDGKTVSHTVKTPIPTNVIEPTEEQPTMEEQILFETKYQTLLLETMTLGGN